ncbi:hypothetical protein [Flammeovirga aprica]|uniref:Uncharacterized protein n=1 Tax=Flammeovirga aprica JL-4 TaxID=694437 RepID=A0A7X9RZF9_9BACT|nr:hypothetical protein [Flammeovirga aprica]NME71452.1 hypothetical protein [Flammeovirga aprica JL-4]
MKQLIYFAFISLFFMIIGCEKQDPLRTIETEYLDSVHYDASVFYPLEDMISPEPVFENKYGVSFAIEEFYNDKGDSSQINNVAIDKKTGIISVRDASLLDQEATYHANIATFTVSGKTIHEKAWSMGITQVTGELFYSTPQPSYERNFEGEVLHLDSAFFGEANAVVSYELVNSDKGLSIDASNGHISKVSFMEAGEYDVAVKVLTEGGETTLTEVAKVKIYGAPELVYQPNFFKIQGDYSIQATPTVKEFLDGATYELKVQGDLTLNSLAIDENAVISLPENHNNAVGEYKVDVIATVDGQAFTFEEAITVEIVAQINPEISYAENKVTLSPWTGYTFTPELYSLPRNAVVTLTTVLPEGMTFDSETGSITIAEEQNFADATYTIDINVNTPSHGDTPLTTLTQIVIETKAQILLEDDMTSDALKADYIRQQVVINDDERSGATWNTTASREYCRAQANIWSGDYTRWSYIAVSYTVDNIRRATVSFDNGVNKDLRDTDEYTENYFSVNYNADYNGSEAIHDFAWEKDSNANISRVGTDIDNGPYEASGLLEIDAKYLVNNKVNIAWLAHKDMTEIPESFKTGHTFGFNKIVVTAYTKYDAVVE